MFTMYACQHSFTTLSLRKVLCVVVTDHLDKAEELLHLRTSLGIKPWPQTVRYVEIFIRFI